jgi:glycosyltransferase involved in cell wall biosynthesis
MRIAYVCADPGVPVFGTKGSSIHVQEVVRGFLREGAQVELFATRLDGPVPAGMEGVRSHWLPALPKGELEAREEASIGANYSLYAALQRQAPFDLVYERYSLWSFAGMEYARAAGASGVLEVNAPLIEEQLRYRGLANRSAAEAVAQRVFSAAKVILAVSHEVAEHLARYSGTEDRVQVVPNGVDPNRFPPGLPPTHPAPPNAITIGFVGTLKPWHGLGLMVDAFAKLYRDFPAARLLIVGDGPERESLLDHLGRAGVLPAAHLTGAVDPADIPGLLASIDVAVAPYPLNGNFYFSPLKVYEYMAAGRPVVASRIGQLVEVIQHEESGLLCDPGDAEALAAALKRLCEDRVLAERLGRNARERVLRHHTWDAVVQRILELAGIQSGERRALLVANR